MQILRVTVALLASTQVVAHQNGRVASDGPVKQNKLRPPIDEIRRKILEDEIRSKILEDEIRGRILQTHQAVEDPKANLASNSDLFTVSANDKYRDFHSATFKGHKNQK